MNNALQRNKYNQLTTKKKAKNQSSVKMFSPAS